jgi:subtilisin family serine protease
MEFEDTAANPEGNYTDGFGGTSSATPLVAGIIGLMLSINPDLTEKEVRAILMRTAEKIGDKNSYKPDPETGNSHSELYGYGRVKSECISCRKGS